MRISRAAVLVAFILLLPGCGKGSDVTPAKEGASAAETSSSKATPKKGPAAKTTAKATPARPAPAKRTLAELEGACGKADFAACGKAARIYSKGHGVKADGVKALALSEKSCGGKNPDGCALLAVLHLGAGETPTNRANYEKFAKMACELDDTGCFALGIQYMGDSPGIAKDPAKLEDLFGRSCKAGSGFGCVALGGQRLAAKKMEEGIELMKQGCFKGDAAGCFQYGIGLLIGRGIKQNKKEAAVIIRKGCDEYSAESCWALGMMYADPKTGLAFDAEKSRAAYTKSCNLGHQPGCDKLK